MKLSKKILMILFGVFFYLGIYYYFKESKLLNNDFTEFNHFDLFIDINSDNNNHLENLVKKINQFDNYVTYSYIDKSYDLILHNSLKNKSISEIDSYTKLFKVPTFNNLFEFMSDLSLSYENKFNKKIINVFINQLFEFCLDENIDYNFSNHLLESLLIDQIDVNKMDNQLSKIVVTSDKKFNTSSDKKNQYFDLFDYINSIIRHNSIKYIKFYNRYAYDSYVDFNESNVTNIIPVYKPIAIFYNNSLDSSYVLTEKINDYLNKNSSISIHDYLTDKSIIGDKYKKIKNISIYSSAYKKIHGIKKGNIDRILIDLESFIENIEKYGNIEDYELVDKINFIYEYFKHNKNNFRLNRLVNDYNINAPLFIKDIANTEPVDLEFVDTFIYDDFYNEKNDAFVIKVLLDKNEYLLYRKFLFAKGNSLYLNARIQILNIIFSIFMFLSFLYVYKVKNK